MSARSAMVTSRRSAGLSGSPERPFDLAIDARKIIASPCDQIFGRLESVAERNCIDQFAGDDDVLRRDDVDAMGERVPAELRVEQRNDAADAGDAEPDRQVFGPVRHHQADGLALGELLRERPAGVAVGALD